MNLATVSNRELNIWATLFVDLSVTAYYFSKVLSLPQGTDLSSAAMGAVVGKVIVLAIILSIIVFSLINWNRGEEQKDERDFRFETRANAVGYYVLSICIVGVIGHVVMNTVFARLTNANSFLFSLTPMVIAHALLLTLLIASSAKALVQLYYYRRGY